MISRNSLPPPPSPLLCSSLGPLLSVSVFAEEDPRVAEKFFSGKQGQAQVRAMAQQLQQDLEFVRVSRVEGTVFLLYFFL